MSHVNFFWGQHEMTYLRFLTIHTAVRLMGPRVRLIVRTHPIQPAVTWTERQDFQHVCSNDYYSLAIDAVKNAGGQVVPLEVLSPVISDMKAPDVHTSDLLGWFILSTEGGWIADMDILWIRPLPEVTEDVHVVRFTGAPKADYVPVSLMGGRPCGVWDAACVNAMTDYDPAVYESCGTGCLPPGVKGNLPETIIFPWAGDKFRTYRPRLFESNRYPEVPYETVGLHWYAGRNQDYNQRITSFGDLPKVGAFQWHARRCLQ